MSRVEIELPDSATPGQHGVYVTFDADGEVLYIGRTQNLSARLKTHRSTSEWFKRTRSIEFTPCSGVSEARAVEKSMIATFRPNANILDHAPQQVSTRQRLPEWTVARLVSMYEACADARGDSVANDRLNSYILALRQAGWTLAAIGEALGMTREGVRLRAARSSRPDRSSAIPKPPVRQKPGKKVRPSIPPVALARLRELQVDARQVRGWTPLDSPLRQASERFSELLAEQYLAGVSIHRIAKQLGVTDLAIRARLARHGYMEPVVGLANQTPYGSRTHFLLVGKGASDTCKDGHKLSGTNLRLVNGDPKRRVCRTCERRRSQEYKARKRRAA